jgi:hypothetical protein
MSEQCAQGRGDWRPKLVAADLGNYENLALWNSHSGPKCQLPAIHRRNFVAAGACGKLKSRQVPAALPARWSSRSAACSNR